MTRVVRALAALSIGGPIGLDDASDQATDDRGFPSGAAWMACMARGASRLRDGCGPRAGVAEHFAAEHAPVAPVATNTRAGEDRSRVTADPTCPAGSDGLAPPGVAAEAAASDQRVRAARSTCHGRIALHINAWPSIMYPLAFGRRTQAFLSAVATTDARCSAEDLSGKRLVTRTRTARIAPLSLPGRLESSGRAAWCAARAPRGQVQDMVASRDKIADRLLRALDAVTGSPEQKLAVVSWLFERYASSLAPEQALRFLLVLHHRIYKALGRQAIRYGGGVHTKHRHMKYHDFFVNKIEAGAHVLDVGSGVGALAYSIATRVPDVKVCGIEIASANLALARERFSAPNLEFLHCDATGELPAREIDTIVMSNVLEHISDRVGLLRNLRKAYGDARFLIRVPTYERDWLVPLKEELGVDYRLDPTHEIEYRAGELEAELFEAGLELGEASVQWGEIWACGRAARSV